MKLTIEMNLDNDAFQLDGGVSTLAILNAVKDALHRLTVYADYHVAVMDTNGNDVGRATLYEETVTECDHDYEWSRGCGAKVCTKCDDHKGLARCYCGWSSDGGNGRAQLIEMGETIDPEE